MLMSNSENLAFALHFVHNFVHLIEINEVSFMISLSPEQPTEVTQISDLLTDIYSEDTQLPFRPDTDCIYRSFFFMVLLSSLTKILE